MRKIFRALGTVPGRVWRMLFLSVGFLALLAIDRDLAATVLVLGIGYRIAANSIRWGSRKAGPKRRAFPRDAVRFDAEGETDCAYVNPDTGLPMIGGLGGVDAAGYVYGDGPHRRDIGR